MVKALTRFNKDLVMHCYWNSAGEIPIICTNALPLIGRTCFPLIFTGKTKLIKNAKISNAHFYVMYKDFNNVETVCFLQECVQ